jgi:hypothetical protein
VRDDDNVTGVLLHNEPLQERTGALVQLVE